MSDDKHPIRHPIRFKIFLVSLVPTIALVAAALMNSQYLSALGDSAEQILSKNYKSIRAAQEARKIVEAVRNQLLINLSRGQEGFVVSDAQLQNLSAHLNLCRENVTESGEQELIDALFESYGQYEPAVSSLQVMDHNLWQSKQFASFLALTTKLVSLIDELVAINEMAMERAEQETRSLADQAQRNAAMLFGVIITGILALSYFLSYRIAKAVQSN